MMRVTPTQKHSLTSPSWLRSLWNAAGTGGLYWHWHALTHRALWQPAMRHIADFLASKTITTSHLILIGPSAGWMLPTSWLMQFKRIDVYDIDPLVPLLFGIRHARHVQRAGAQVNYHRMDAIGALEAILHEHPQACVWFDNVLGQHRYRVRDLEATERDLLALKTQLAGRAWGSVHDWLSGPVRAITPLEAIKAVAAQSLDPAWGQQRLADIQAHGTWSDHLTSGVFPAELDCQYVAWPYSQEYSHWLQMGWVNA